MKNKDLIEILQHMNPESEIHFSVKPDECWKYIFCDFNKEIMIEDDGEDIWFNLEEILV